MRIGIRPLEVFALGAALGCLAFTNTASASCGDGVIEALEGCDDGNMANGDGCSALCLEELGYDCVPSLFATGVNDAGTALPSMSADPHWTWSETNDELTGVPAIAARRYFSSRLAPASSPRA